MVTATVGSGGEILLDLAVLERHRLLPNTRIRVVETLAGVLLIPLTDDPMTPSQRRELDEWQSLSAKRTEPFPYDWEADDVTGRP